MEEKTSEQKKAETAAAIASIGAAVEKLQTENPTARVVPLRFEVEHTGEVVRVVAVVPERKEWQMFNRAIADADKRPRALEDLVRACVRYPDAVGLDDLLRRLPGVAQTFGNTLAKLAGASGEAEVGNF